MDLLCSDNMGMDNHVPNFGSPPLGPKRPKTPLLGPKPHFWGPKPHFWVRNPTFGSGPPLLGPKPQKSEKSALFALLPARVAGQKIPANPDGEKCQKVRKVHFSGVSDSDSARRGVRNPTFGSETDRKVTEKCQKSENFALFNQGPHGRLAKSRFSEARFTVKESVSTPLISRLDLR